MKPGIQLNRLIILGFALAASIAVPLAGCGSSGGGGVMTPAIVLTYVPVSGTGAATVTTLSGVGSTDGIAVVEIYVTGVLDVLTASFMLSFDTASVAFLDFDVSGSHLASDGASIQPIVQQVQSGELTVGLTRLGATGIDFNGTQLLMRIRFVRVASSGTSTLTFSNNDLLDAMAPPQSIPGVQWFGGEFQIN
ncbi:MAG: hypothetical protein E2P01_04550 [Acidobacteria bacterium]|nr:MAG: hypothetical protein E2P01_04550 [Acidobacteriota bacterium]